MQSIQFYQISDVIGRENTHQGLRLFFESEQQRKTI